MFAIHNGIDVASFAFQRGGAGLAFLGRMELEKGPDLAVRIAQELNLPLTLAGQIPIVDRELFDKQIQPHLNDQIRYIGLVNHEQRNKLFGNAAVALVPSRVPEGFGMVSIEAMACGTPVVALASGALPEVVEPGVTGYVTHDENELGRLVLRALQLDRQKIRDRVTAKFELSVVAQSYLKLLRENCSRAELDETQSSATVSFGRSFRPMRRIAENARDGARAYRRRRSAG